MDNTGMSESSRLKKSLGPFGDQFGVDVTYGESVSRVINGSRTTSRRSFLRYEC